MKLIKLVLLAALLSSCNSTKKEKAQPDSLAQAADPAVINPTLNRGLATKPIFKNYSSEVLTEDERESTIVTSLASLLAIYLMQQYFSIVSDGKAWHLDEKKQLRVITIEKENETLKENSIYLFNEGKLIAWYSDADMSGMDTQRNRERVAVNKCPDCGIRVDLMSGQPNVTVLGESRVNELTKYFNDDYNSVLTWLAQAPIRSIVGNNCVFERSSPTNARYTVNNELYNKFIKNINH